MSLKSGGGAEEPLPPKLQYTKNSMTTRQRQLIMVAVVLTLGSALRLYEGFYGVPLDQVVWSDMKGYVQTADMIRIDQ